MVAPSSSLSHSSSHVLTSGGFRKLPLVAENEHKQKVRLYHLDPLSEKVEVAKAALESKLKSSEWEYQSAEQSFEEGIKQAPYLLREGYMLRLLSTKDAIELQLKYGVIGPKAEKETLHALKLLEEHNVKTDGQLVAFYNQSPPAIQNALLPFINAMFFIFSKERTVLKPEEVKTIVLLGQCDNEGIQNGALTLLSDLFERFDFSNADYGFGLKYLLDEMSEKFLQKNQLFLVGIFDKLSSQLDRILYSGKSVNHEIDPLMSSLISTARALLKAGLKNLNKETKDSFYKRLKAFYQDERYLKKIEALSSRTNYLLVHQSLWTIQHLVRISSSEHKAVTALRKIGHGLLAMIKLAETTTRVGSAVMRLEIPDFTAFAQGLKETYEHGEKAFGIKDIPRPWYDMLESTEQVLLDLKLSVGNLDKLHELIDEYDKVREKFNDLVKNQFKKLIGKEKVTLETKEFAFGLVGQLTHVAMDHPQETVRAKALDILEKIFNKDNQSQDVQLLILTTLQNMIDQKCADAQQAKQLQARLHQKEPALEKVELFRQSKYPCLALMPESSALLEAAKGKLQAVSQGTQPLPLSEFIYGKKDIKIFKQLIKVRLFKPKGPEPFSAEELERGVNAAIKLYSFAFDRNTGNQNVRSKFENVKETTFDCPIEADIFEG